MYYVDSGRRCIEEYAYDYLTGAIYFIRTAVQVPVEYGVPDGMTIDANGLLWWLIGEDSVCTFGVRQPGSLSIK